MKCKNCGTEFSPDEVAMIIEDGDEKQLCDFCANEEYEKNKK